MMQWITKDFVDLHTSPEKIRDRNYYKNMVFLVTFLNFLVIAPSIWLFSHDSRNGQWSSFLAGMTLYCFLVVLPIFFYGGVSCSLIVDVLIAHSSLLGRIVTKKDVGPHYFVSWLLVTQAVLFSYVSTYFKHNRLLGMVVEKQIAHYKKTFPMYGKQLYTEDTK